MNAVAEQREPSILDYDQGIHPDVPEDVYHRRVPGVVNAGALKILATQTPAHYRAWLDADDSDESGSDVLMFGKAMHCAILEPDRFDETYVIAQQHPYRRPSIRQINAKNPSQDTLDAIAYFEAFDEANKGKIEISADLGKTLRAIQKSVLSHPLARNLFHDVQTEQTIVWLDKRTGLQCKARMDAWRPDISLCPDLKTAESAAPGAFSRAVARYHYHIQHAHYLAGLQAIGIERPQFGFVPVEKHAPYQCAVYKLDPEAEDRGFELRDHAMDLMLECIESDHWPGYSEAVESLSLPGWAFRD